MIFGKKVSWSYTTKKDSVRVIKEISFTIPKGRITTFIGPSGSGKTTLLKCIANLHANYRGSIFCNGQELKTLPAVERSSTIGFVLQQLHLFSHLSVLENCTFALIKTKFLNPDQAKLQALEILEPLGLLPFIHALPTHLSGGQQQRVAIARALALQPDALLLDEPTSALDPQSKKELEKVLLQLNAQGVTIALSSHDMPFIRQIKDCIYFLQEGEIVEQWDRREELLHPQSKIAQFLHAE